MHSDVFEKFFQQTAKSHKTNWGFVNRSKNYSFDYFLVKAAHFVFNQGNRGKNKKTKCLKKRRKVECYIFSRSSRLLNHQHISTTNLSFYSLRVDSLQFLLNQAYLYRGQ